MLGTKLYAELASALSPAPLLRIRTFAALRSRLGSTMLSCVLIRLPLTVSKRAISRLHRFHSQYPDVVFIAVSEATLAPQLTLQLGNAGVTDLLTMSSDSSPCAIRAAVMRVLSQRRVDAALSLLSVGGAPTVAKLIRVAMDEARNGAASTRPLSVSMCAGRLSISTRTLARRCQYEVVQSPGEIIRLAFRFADCNVDIIDTAPAESGCEAELRTLFAAASRHRAADLDSLPVPMWPVDR